MNAIRPIFSSLSRHKGAVLILVLEVALTCAILCNAFDLISRRIDAINLPTGVDEAHLVKIESGPLTPDSEIWPRTHEDLAVLRAVPGVANASVINQIPLTSNSSNSGVTTAVEGKEFTSAGITMGDDAILDTLGVKLIAGRKFTPDDFETVKTAGDFGALSYGRVIVTKALAEKLFPGQNAVGKAVYMGEPKPMQIIGIVEDLVRPGNWMGSEARRFTLIAPVRMPVAFIGQYIVRVKEGSDPAAVLKAGNYALNKAYPRRITGNLSTFAQLREDYYAADRSMAWMLSIVAGILLLITAFGIVGLASFWVQQRTKQIGVRRALGATKSDILRYFQTENFLIVTMGVVLGMVLAYALNQLLMSKYEMPRLPWVYLPVGAVILWVLGQLAVLAPALRAASIPPATATRSV